MKKNKITSTEQKKLIVTWSILQKTQVVEVKVKFKSLFVFFRIREWLSSSIRMFVVRCRRRFVNIRYIRELPCPLDSFYRRI